MPRYNTARDWHVDRPLTNLSIALTQDTTNFIANRVGTNIPVSFESDLYTVYPQGYWNREYNSNRAEEGVANSVNYRTRQASYVIGDKSLRIFISDRKRANADSQYNLDREGMALVSNSLLIGEEIDFKEKFLDFTGASGSPVSSSWTNTLGGGSAIATDVGFVYWDNTASDPVGDWKRHRRDFVLRSAGKMPNEIVMTLDVFDTLTENASIIDRIKTTGVNMPATISRQMLAGLFEVANISVIQTVVNTAHDAIEDADGEVPVNNTFLASGLFLALYNEPTGGLMSATAIGNFNLPAFTGANLGPRFRRYRGVEGRDGDYIEGQLRVDRRIVAQDLGQLWGNIITPTP